MILRPSDKVALLKVLKEIEEAVNDGRLLDGQIVGRDQLTDYAFTIERK